MCYCVVELNYIERIIQVELDFKVLKIVDEKFPTENYSDWVLCNGVVGNLNFIFYGWDYRREMIAFVVVLLFQLHAMYYLIKGKSK